MRIVIVVYRKIDPEKHRSLEVATQIKELIRTERLKRGEKLPNELELCRLFSVSRPTIREAIKSLVSQNVIDIRRGKGTFVSETPGIVDDPFGLDFIHSPDIDLSLIEVRLIIEPGVAGLAARNADEEDILTIEGYLQRMQENVRRQQVGMDIELDFHRSIAQATKNPVIMRIVPMIVSAIIKTYQDAPRTSEDHSHALEEHIAVYEAIAARDAEGARSAMQHHLDMSYHRTLANRPARPSGSGSP